jgi:hypothetical protein
MAAQVSCGLGFAGQTGAQQDLHAGAIAMGPLCEGETIVITRESGVGKEHMDFRPLRQHSFRFDAARGFDYAIPAIAEIFGYGDTRENIVVCHEDPCAGMANICWRHGSNLVSASRE